MRINVLSRPRSHRRRAGSARIAGLFRLWRSRRQLARLEPHRLSDIGLTAEAARVEAARPLWDAPGTWRILP